MSLEVYTVQLSRWRQVQQSDTRLLDTTVKNQQTVFHPNWHIVLAVKSGEITEDEYTREYIRLMKASLQQHPEAWLDLFKEDKIALACMCQAGKFCHRHILANLIKTLGTKRGVEVNLCGELT